MKLGIAKIIYALFIAVMYIVFGILLLLKYLVWQKEPNISIGLFGIVMVGYGIFRGYRGYKSYNDSIEKQEDEC